MHRFRLPVLCGISLLWGSGWVVVPSLAAVAAPFAAAALKFAIAALALFLISLSRQAERSPGTVLLTVALTLLAIPTALLVTAGRHDVDGWIPLLYSMLPLLTAGERWSPAMALAPGAVLLLLNGTVPFAPGRLAWALPVLVAVGLQAWALRYVARRFQSGSAAASLASAFAIAAALLALGSLLLDPSPCLASPRDWTGGAGLSLLLLSLLGTTLPYAGLCRLLAGSGYRPEQVAVTEWLQTLVMVAESAVVARVHPPWLLVAAAGGLLGCGWAVLRATVTQQALTLLRRDGG